MNINLKLESIIRETFRFKGPIFPHRKKIQSMNFQQEIQLLKDQISELQQRNQSQDEEILDLNLIITNLRRKKQKYKRKYFKKYLDYYPYSRNR